MQVGEGKSERVCCTRLPREVPTSAVSAEFYAVAMLMEILSRKKYESKFQVASDNQAVVSAFAAKQKFFSHKSKFAGMWSVGHLSDLDRVFKVKAHLTQQQAEEQDIVHLWYGNDRADYWAKHAIGDFPAEQHKIQHQQEQRDLKQITDLCVSLQPKLLGVKKNRRVIPGNKAPSVVVSQHCFEFFNQRWGCSRCGISTKKKGKWISKTPCHAAARIVDQVHESHHMFVAACGELDGPVPFVFCAVCACFASARVTGLKRVCRGSSSTHRHLNAILSGKHPVNSVPVWGAAPVSNRPIRFS